MVANTKSQEEFRATCANCVSRLAVLAAALENFESCRQAFLATIDSSTVAAPWFGPWRSAAEEVFDRLDEHGDLVSQRDDALCGVFNDQRGQLSRLLDAYKRMQLRFRTMMRSWSEVELRTRETETEHPWFAPWRSNVAKIKAAMDRSPNWQDFEGNEPGGFAETERWLNDLVSQHERMSESLVKLMKAWDDVERRAREKETQHPWFFHWRDDVAMVRTALAEAPSSDVVRNDGPGDFAKTAQFLADLTVKHERLKASLAKVMKVWIAVEKRWQDSSTQHQTFDAWRREVAAIKTSLDGVPTWKASDEGEARRFGEVEQQLADLVVQYDQIYGRLSGQQEILKRKVEEGLMEGNAILAKLSSNIQEKSLGNVGIGVYVWVALGCTVVSFFIGIGMGVGSVDQYYRNPAHGYVTSVMLVPASVGLLIGLFFACSVDFARGMMKRWSSARRYKELLHSARGWRLSGEALVKKAQAEAVETSALEKQMQMVVYTIDSRHRRG